jgi:hypothetical protein
MPRCVTPRRTPLTRSLCKRIHILKVLARIHQLVVSDIINLVLVQPRLVDHPRRVGEHLVRPPTVPDRLAPLRVGHGWCGLVFRAELVGADPDEEVDGWEGELGLAELQCVTRRGFSTIYGRTVRAARATARGERWTGDDPKERRCWVGRLANVARLTHPKWNRSYTPSAYIRTGLPSGGGLVFHHLSTPSSSPLPSIAR